jgi:hypothetical protein
MRATVEGIKRLDALGTCSTWSVRSNPDERPRRPSVTIIG